MNDTASVLNWVGLGQNFDVGTGYGECSVWYKVG